MVLDFATSAKILELELRQRRGEHPDAPAVGACDEPRAPVAPVRRHGPQARAA
jgi:hypothetical protein